MTLGVQGCLGTEKMKVTKVDPDSNNNNNNK